MEEAGGGNLEVRVPSPPTSSFLPTHFSLLSPPALRKMKEGRKEDEGRKVDEGR